MSAVEVMQYDHQPHIAVLSGGTGGSNLMRELKHHSFVSAIMNMSDDGGSSGRLVEEFGGLPVGDLRQALVALSMDGEMAEWFNYRPQGGHPNGNVWLKKQEIKHGIDGALQSASQLLAVNGEVVPVTRDVHTLVLDDAGKVTRGEYVIGHMPIVSPHARLSLDPIAALHPSAAHAIKQAELRVIAPGNLNGSILPVFAVQGLRKVLREAPAQNIMIGNLLTKPGQTDGWDIVDYVKKLESYAGEGCIDAVIYNTAPISPDMLTIYAQKGEYPLGFDPSRFSEVQAHFIGAHMVASTIRELGNDIAIPRSRILHDAVAVVAQILSYAVSREAKLDHR